MRAGNSRPQHAAVQHPGHFDVRAEVLLRIDLGCDVFARDGLADDGVVFRVFGPGLTRCVQRVADLFVPVELDFEIAPADELAIGGLSRRIRFGVDDALSHGELLGVQAEFCGSHFGEHATRFRCGHAHLLAATPDARRPGSAALVHAAGRIAHDDFHSRKRHVELFGNHLADGDKQPLAHVHLSEKGGDRAVSVHRDVGRELVGRERRFCILRKRLLDCSEGFPADRRSHRHHQRAAGREQRAAGEMRDLLHLHHFRLPQPIISAARLTARRMPICVPQRHLSPLSASLISASLGFFLRSRNAAAVMIQPLMQ